MMPIQDLLHRIQWDPTFGNGRFVIGYYDRVIHRILRVPLRQVQLARGAHFSFTLMQDDGYGRMVPFHRVREVWRDGKLIWQRKAG
jgi:uncharacterized protein (UPF0248 family)